MKRLTGGVAKKRLMMVFFKKRLSLKKRLSNLRILPFPANF